MKRAIMKVLVLCVVLCWFLPACIYSQDLTIRNYSLVSQKRITRTIWEIVYKADIINPGQEARNVTATVISTSPHTVVIEDSLTFGTVPAFGTVISQDTFTIRHDRAYPFDASALVWDIRVSGVGVVLEQTYPMPFFFVPMLDPIGLNTRSVTSSSGNVYTLAMPQGNIFDFQSITMTPIAEIKGFPLANTRPVAAVRLGPSGQRFLKPVTLTIELPAAKNTGRHIGFVCEDHVQNCHFYPIQTSGNTFTLDLSHFTDAGITEAECNSMPPPDPRWTPEQRVDYDGSLLILCQDPSQAIIDAWVSDMKAWMDQIMKEADAASTVDDMLVVLGQYLIWEKKLEPLQQYSNALDATDANAAIAVEKALQTVSTKLHHTCVCEADKNAFINKILQLQKMADLSGFGDVTEFFDPRVCSPIKTFRIKADSVHLPVGTKTPAEIEVLDGDPNVTDLNFTWNSSNDAIISVSPDSGDHSGRNVLLNASGVFGKASIQASVSQCGTTTTAAKEFEVDLVAIDPLEQTLCNPPVTLSAILLDPDGNRVGPPAFGYEISWASSPSNMVQVNPLSGYQADIYPSGLPPGIATVTATIGSSTGSAKIRSSGCASLLLEPAIMELQGNMGGFFTFTSVSDCGTPMENLFPQDIYPWIPCTWQVNPPGVIQMYPAYPDPSRPGYYYFGVQGLASGTADINGTCWYGWFDGTKMVQRFVYPTATVTVDNPLKVEISPSSSTICGDISLGLQAILKDLSGNTVTNPGLPVSWSVSDMSIATVTPTLGNQALVKGVPGKTGAVVVSVKIGPYAGSSQIQIGGLASLAIDPEKVFLAAGESQQLSATAKDACGNVIANPHYQWSSDNIDVATIDPGTGLVHALASGKATIRATYLDGTATATVSVRSLWHIKWRAHVDGVTDANTINTLYGCSDPNFFHDDMSMTYQGEAMVYGFDILHPPTTSSEIPALIVSLSADYAYQRHVKIIQWAGSCRSCGCSLTSLDDYTSSSEISERGINEMRSQIHVEEYSNNNSWIRVAIPAEFHVYYDAQSYDYLQGAGAEWSGCSPFFDLFPWSGSYAHVETDLYFGQYYFYWSSWDVPIDPSIGTYYRKAEFPQFFHSYPIVWEIWAEKVK